MYNLFIPVYVERKAVIRIKAANVEDAISQIKILGNDNQVTGISTKNEGVEINYEEIEDYNPGHTLNPEPPQE